MVPRPDDVMIFEGYQLTVSEHPAFPQLGMALPRPAAAKPGTSSAHRDNDERKLPGEPIVSVREHSISQARLWWRPCCTGDGVSPTQPRACLFRRLPGLTTCGRHHGRNHTCGEVTAARTPSLVTCSGSLGPGVRCPHRMLIAPSDSTVSVSCCHIHTHFRWESGGARHSTLESLLPPLVAAQHYRASTPRHSWQHMLDSALRLGPVFVRNCHVVVDRPDSITLDGPRGVSRPHPSAAGVALAAARALLAAAAAQASAPPSAADDSGESRASVVRSVCTALVRLLLVLLRGRVECQRSVGRLDGRKHRVAAAVQQVARLTHDAAAVELGDILALGGGHVGEQRLATALRAVGVREPHGLLFDARLGYVLGNKRVCALLCQLRGVRWLPRTVFTLQAFKEVGALHGRRPWFRKEPLASEGNGVCVVTAEAGNGSSGGDGDGNRGGDGDGNSGGASGDNAGVGQGVVATDGTAMDVLPIYQQGVHSPLLWQPGNRKFDCRVYVLWWRDGSVLVHRQALLRVCDQAYDPHSLTRGVQLTNVARGASSVPSYLWPRWRSLFTAAVVPLVRDVAVAFAQFHTPSHCLLTGFDILFDDTERPWLLEVNRLPQLQPSVYHWQCRGCMPSRPRCPKREVLRDVHMLARHGLPSVESSHKKGLGGWVVACGGTGTGAVVEPSVCQHAGDGVPPPTVV